jgi:HlyD family secretion protein
MKKALLWVSLLLVLAAGGTAYFVMRPSASADTAGSTGTVERGKHEVLVRSQGLIVSATTIEMKSRASGLVQAIHATAGDRVRTDQILLEVDPARSRLNEEEMRNEVENARSQVRLAEESIDPDRVALAERKLTRARELSKEGLNTREAIEQAEYDFAASERALRNQRQQLEAQQRRLEVALTRLRRAEIESTFTIIRSPIDGVVLSRAVEIGSGVTSFSDSAQGGTVLFKIGSLDRLAFDGNLAISDLTKIKPGLAARVTSDAWREATTGVVTYVAQEAIAPSQGSSAPNRAPTFQVKIELEAAAKDLPLNVPATAEIIVETLPDALVVPYSCVRHLPNGQGTLRESANGTVRERSVKLGPVTAGKVQIIGDVAQGTHVVGCGRASGDGTPTTVVR